MKKASIKKEKRERRHKRIRARIFGTGETPRLSVFRSSKYMYAQLVDDERGVTLASVSDVKAPGKTKTDRATAAGKTLAAAAKKKGITKAVFDRGGFAYHGRVKALAEGVREGGLAC